MGETKKEEMTQEATEGKNTGRRGRKKKEKVKKVKVKKERKKKVKKEKGEGKKLGKKQIMIFAAILILLLSAASFGAAYMLNKKKKPKVYFPEEDQIYAITEVVGKRKEVKLEEEEEKKEEEKKEKKKNKKKDKEEEKDKEDQEEPEEEEEDPGPITEKHQYTNVENSAEDVGAYITFLMDQNQFVALNDYDVTNPEGKIELAADSKINDKVIRMNIEYNEEGYIIDMVKEEGSVEKIQQEIEEARREQEEKEKEDNYISRTAAENQLRKCTPEQLGIDGDMENFSVIFDVGLSIINENVFYGLNVYEKKEQGAMYIKGIFYVACDGSSIYKYNLENDSYHLLQD